LHNTKRSDRDKQNWAAGHIQTSSQIEVTYKVLWKHVHNTPDYVQKLNSIIAKLKDAASTPNDRDF
jgi:hypothetical protein